MSWKWSGGSFPSSVTPLIILELVTEDDCSLLESLLYRLYSLRDTVDEVYCYLIKMITDNPSPVSEMKGFEVLFLLSRCILPSNNFFNYCLRFCYNSVQNRDDVRLLSSPHS